jgi:hypothetical protein
LANASNTPSLATVRIRVIVERSNLPVVGGLCQVHLLAEQLQEDLALLQRRQKALGASNRTVGIPRSVSGAHGR